VYGREGVEEPLTMSGYLLAALIACVLLDMLGDSI
jgi:hypothetical protein